MEQVRPDYGGSWVGAVMPALLSGVSPSGLALEVARARGVVLLVLDGLGWNALTAHPDRLATIAAMQGGCITTVFPSTTASALTSITTGLTPAEHGLIGYRMRVGGELLNTLQWRVAGNGRAPAPEDVQPHPPFLGNDVPVLTRSEFRNGGFSRAHLRGTTGLGWQTPAVMVEHCRRLAGDGVPFIYAYYDGVDKVAHAHGLSDGFYAAELGAADRLVADLLNALPPDYVLVVTSDHGQVDVAPDDHHDVGALRALLAVVSGEARFRSLYARPGASGDLEQAAAELYGESAWIFTREELVRGQWLGLRAGSSVTGRIGDVVLAAKGTNAFLDPAFPAEADMLSMHGSLTPAEMCVPLLAAFPGD